MAKEKEKREYTRHEIDHEKFVAAWQKNDNVAAVAAALGIEKRTATSFAMRLRKLGVGLIKYKTKVSISKEDLSKLKELAKKLAA